MSELQHVATPLRKPPAPTPTLPGQGGPGAHSPGATPFAFNLSVDGETSTYRRVGDVQHALMEALRDVHAGTYISLTVTPERL